MASQPKAGGGSDTWWVLLVGAIAIGVCVVLAAPALLSAFQHQHRGGGSGVRPVVRFEGSRIMTTAGQYLEGDYRVDWTATGSGTVGCYHGADLRDAHDGLAEILLSQQVNGPASGTTTVYGLEPGIYHIDASSGCDSWSFTFTP